MDTDLATFLQKVCFVKTLNQNLVSPREVRVKQASQQRDRGCQSSAKKRRKTGEIL
jgi:hypothetical protein